jgi:hypothetical protein
MRRLILPCLLVAACRTAEVRAPASDSAFAQMQSRGKEAMGVDQYTSAHQFDDLPNGGRIELQRDSTDTAGVRTIREHLRHIVLAFGEGDFSLPGFVHAETVPGTAVMTVNRALITYEFRPLSRGGEVLLTSSDSASVSAIHAFLAFQRQDHHAGGMVHQ